MKKLALMLLVCILLLASTGAVSAASNGNVAEPPEVAMGVFIDYAHSGGPSSWTDSEDNYRIRAGITWSDLSAVTYSVNPNGNGSDESDSDVINAVNSGLSEWQNGPSAWMVSTGFAAYAYEGTTSSIGANRDYANTVSWQSIDGAGGAVAACYYWYYPNTKTIVEFDIVFDSGDPWGIGTGNYYDIQNVATHEWGHTLVLFDLYSPKDGALTMYGYASKGDVDKQTLGYGDALGVAELYPPTP